MEKWLAKRLDAHLLLLIVAFNKQDNQAFLDAVEKTGLVDLALEVEPNNAQLLQKREALAKELAECEEKSVPILKNIESGVEVEQDQLESLRVYAKVAYEIGQYEFSSALLKKYRELVTREDLKLAALWGELAGQIMLGRWDIAYQVIGLLKEAIEVANVDKYTQLEFRTWLAHWSLFVLFAIDNGKQLIDMLFQEKFLNAIQTESQHLLRYLVAAVVMNRTRKTPAGKPVLGELRRIVSSEDHNYSDPITSFFKAVYVDHDFEFALDSLKKSEEILKNDYFLNRYAQEFRQEASMFYFEIYCRVHKMIDIGLMDSIVPDQDGERCLVDLIRRNRLDAKIDSSGRRVVMGSSIPSVHLRVIEKTKMLQYNASQLLYALDRKYNEASSVQE
jgi:translation initiation factor 3 subunit E